MRGDFGTFDFGEMTDDEIKAAYPKTTQTIEIETFVPADSIPFVYLERPYYVAPINRGGKVYALLRETLNRSERVGVARVVIQTKQHLAVLPRLVDTGARGLIEDGSRVGLVDGQQVAHDRERELGRQHALVRYGTKFDEPYNGQDIEKTILRGPVRSRGGLGIGLLDVGDHV